MREFGRNSIVLSTRKGSAQRRGFNKTHIISLYSSMRKLSKYISATVIHQSGKRSAAQGVRKTKPTLRNSVAHTHNSLIYKNSELLLKDSKQKKKEKTSKQITTPLPTTEQKREFPSIGPMTKLLDTSVRILLSQASLQLPGFAGITPRPGHSTVFQQHQDFVTKIV